MYFINNRSYSSILFYTEKEIMESPLMKKMKGPKCWKGYVAKGKKKSPSGKKGKGGKIKMVNNCVKIKKR